MEVLKFIYHNVIQFRKNIIWTLEALKERKKIKYKTCNLNSDIAGRIMILIPHADDEWIGCSRIIMCKEDVLLCNMDMQGGDTDSLHKRRYKELRYLADKYQKSLVTAKGVEDLEKEIIKFEPEVIMVPYYIDWHVEHIEVMRRLKEIITNNDNWKNLKVAMYQVSLPIMADKITNYFVLTRTEWKEKWKEFRKIYSSQKHIPHVRFALNEYINGGIAGVHAVEVYVVMPATKWAEILNEKILTQEEQDEYISILGSITKVRRTLKNK